MSKPDLLITIPEPDSRPHLVTGAPTTAPVPRLHYEDGGATIWHGDCIETMTLLPADSFDAVITDPPYGLEFMGREWDTFKPSGTVAANVTEGTDASHPFRDGSTRIHYGRADLHAFEDWCAEWATQALRVLKPGGHLLAFGGSRTWHRLTSGIEDAGFEIRDSIAWLYASGFPKSLDVSAAIDRQRDSREGLLQFTEWCRAARDAAGVTNAWIDAAFGLNGMAGHWTSNKAQPAVPTMEQVPLLLEVLRITIDDVPPEIRELIVFLNGQKGQPGAAWFERPVTGEHESPAHAAEWRNRYQGGETKAAAERRDEPATAAARQWAGWGTALKPAFEPIVVARKPLAGTVATNVLLYGTGAINIDANRLGEKWPTNLLISHAPLRDDLGNPTGDACAGGCVEGCPVRELGDQARFYPAFRFEAKAPTSERPSVVDESGNTVQHPTVKPLDLMRWLVRLVIPKGGHILEPFAGSGTTVEAAVVEGVAVTAIELGADYLPLIEKRIRKDHQQTLFGDLA